MRSTTKLRAREIVTGSVMLTVTESAKETGETRTGIAKETETASDATLVQQAVVKVITGNPKRGGMASVVDALDLALDLVPGDVLLRLAVADAPVLPLDPLARAVVLAVVTGGLPIHLRGRWEDQ